MYKLLEFLKNKAYFFLFIILEVFAVYLITNKTVYQGTVLLGTSNQFVAKVLSVKGEIDRYTGLHPANLELMKANAELERKILKLSSLVERFKIDTMRTPKILEDLVLSSEIPFQFEVAEVVNKSTLTKTNYITLDKGKQDGIWEDMGVLSLHGVVGVVVASSQHFSKVLPLVNNSFSLSCTLSKGGNVGSLMWDGDDPSLSVLTNLPKHVVYHKGDSVFTSGYSAIFPSGIFVGTVENETKSLDDNFLSLKVRLATDFNTLKYVYVIHNKSKAEIDSLTMGY